MRSPFRAEHPDARRNNAAFGQQDGLTVQARPHDERLLRVREEIKLTGPVVRPSVLRAQPRVFSFTFGTPAREQMRTLREREIYVVGPPR